MKESLSSLFAVFLGAFYKIPFVVPYWDSAEFKAVLSCIVGGKTAQGKEQEEFLKSFIRFVGAKYGVATNMGRSAIEIALRSTGTRGGEVIISSFGCRAMVNPVIKAGFKPVFADIDDDFNISPESVLKNITKDTRAIFVAHIGGKPAKIKELSEIAKEKNIILIDDACQALGAKYDEKYLGTFGNFGIFSFGMGKIIMASQGGVLVTNSEDSIKKINKVAIYEQNKWQIMHRLLHKTVKHYFRRFTAPFFIAKDFVFCRLFPRPSDVYGVFKMANLDSAVLKVQLQKINEIINRRKENAKDLYQELRPVKEIVLPDHAENNVFSKFIISLKDGVKPEKVGECQEVKNFRRFLMKKGIETEAVYAPLHLLADYKKYSKCSLPKVENLYCKSIILPVRPGLEKQDILFMSKIIKQYFNYGQK